MFFITDQQMCSAARERLVYEKPNYPVCNFVLKDNI